jgi:hypothetical protein
VSDVGRFRRGARPFDFTIGVPRPGRYPPDDLDVPGAIEAIRFASVEVGYGFDAMGRQVFRHVGQEDRIWGMTLHDLAAITEGTFVHNHPPYVTFGEGDPRRRAGSFSLLDLVFMYEHSLVRLVAVTQERTYFVSRREEGFFLDPSQLRVDYGEFLRQTHRHLMRLAAEGIISHKEAESEGRIADDVMERLGVNFTYHWEEVRGDAPRPR